MDGHCTDNTNGRARRCCLTPWGPQPKSPPKTAAWQFLPRPPRSPALKLATLKDGTRDGRLIVVKRDNTAYALATNVALTLQSRAGRLERTGAAAARAGRSARGGHGAEPPAGRWARCRRRCRAPTSGSTARAYLNHVLLVRKARSAEPPPTLKTDPLVYQGGSGDLLAPTRRTSRCATRRGAWTSRARSASSSATRRRARRPPRPGSTSGW